MHKLGLVVVLFNLFDKVESLMKMSKRACVVLFLIILYHMRDDSIENLEFLLGRLAELSVT